MAQAQNFDSPYLTSDEAAKYLRYPSTRWFLKHVKRHGIPCLQRGRRKFFTRDGLDQFMAVADEVTNGKKPRRKRAN